MIAFKFLTLLQVASLIVHTYYAIGGTEISRMGRCLVWNCSEMSKDSKGFPTTSSFFLAQLAAKTDPNRGNVKNSGNSQW